MCFVECIGWAWWVDGRRERFKDARGQRKQKEKVREGYMWREAERECFYLVYKQGGL